MALRDVIRCAYFASAASSGADSGAGAYPAPLNRDTAGTHSLRGLVSYNEASRDNRQDSGSATLCLLDDPLTSLDAHTREHVLHHCIHGLMRGNPGVAVVVTCGEIDPAEDKNRSSMSLPLGRHSFDRVVSLGSGSDSTGMCTSSGKLSGVGTPTLPGPATGVTVPPSSQSASSAASAQARPGVEPAAAAAVTGGAKTTKAGSKAAEAEGVARLPRDVGIEDGDDGGKAGVVGGGGVAQGGEGPGIGDEPVEEEERKDGSVEARVSWLRL